MTIEKSKKLLHVIDMLLMWGCGTLAAGATSENVRNTIYHIGWTVIVMAIIATLIVKTHMPKSGRLA